MKKENLEKVNSEKVNPIEFEIQLSDVIDRFDGGNFEIVKTKKEIEFRAKGGLRIFANKKLASLYEPIDFILKACKGELDENTYDLEAVNTMVSAITQILEMPMWIFNNQKMALDVAMLINQTMMDMYQKSASELKDDDNPELTESLGDAMVAAEELGKVIDESKNSKNAENKS